MIILNEGLLNNDVEISSNHDFNIKSELGKLISESTNGYNKILMDFTSKYFLCENTVILNEGFKDVIQKIIEFFKQLKVKILEFFNKSKKNNDTISKNIDEKIKNAEKKKSENTKHDNLTSSDSKNSEKSEPKVHVYKGYHGLNLKELNDLSFNVNKDLNKFVFINLTTNVNNMDDIKNAMDDYNETYRKIVDYEKTLLGNLDVLKDVETEFEVPENKLKDMLSEIRAVSEKVINVTQSIEKNKNSVVNEIDKISSHLMSIRTKFDEHTKYSTPNEYNASVKKFYVEASNILSNMSKSLTTTLGTVQSFATSVNKYLFSIIP